MRVPPSGLPASIPMPLDVRGFVLVAVGLLFSSDPQSRRSLWTYNLPWRLALCGFRSRVV